MFYLDRTTYLLDLLSKTQFEFIQPDQIRRGQKIRILRKKNSENGLNPQSDTITLKIDLYDLLVDGKKKANILLQHGDIIYLPKAQMFHVIGEVKQPGSFVYEEGMTILTAIAKAGGKTDKASSRAIKIRRIENGKETLTKTSMSGSVRPGDVIEVPFGDNKRSVHVIGEVIRPGTVAYEEGLTVLMAITKAGGATKKASVKNTVLKRIRKGKEIKIKVNMGTKLQPGDILEVPLSFW
jgi:protein involved in polysaccharide export with SLBB domain